MNAAQKASMYERIEKHGRILLSIFPNATITDPFLLHNLLKSAEKRGHRFGLRLCNGPEFASEEEEDRVETAILDRVDFWLNFRASGIPVFLNRDPRGYALKIDDEWIKGHGFGLPNDWGGFGLIAPDLT